MGRALALAVIASTALAASAPARAGEPDPGAREDEVAERLRFIERHLDAQVAGAEAWTGGWATFNVAAGGFEIYRAAGTRDRAARTDDIVGVAKATIGITGRLARPLHSRRGAAELRGVPDATPSERERKLALAERLLYRNAREADLCRQWLPHVINVALNVAGAIVVWAVSDAPGVAWQSAGIGIAVGEVVIWTQPMKAKRDARDYQRRFGDERAPAATAALPALALAPLGVVTPGRATAGAARELRV
jgi:hypothetical protein